MVADKRMGSWSRALGQYILYLNLLAETDPTRKLYVAILAGVPKEDIVLAFHAPEMRPYTEFAAA